LEAKQGSVFAKSHLRSSPGVLVALVEDGLPVRFFGEQDMVQDTSDLVCRRGDRLRGSEFGAHTPEELSKVSLGAAQRIGA
jgi:hypothetical protein